MKLKCWQVAQCSVAAQCSVLTSRDKFWTSPPRACLDGYKWVLALASRFLFLGDGVINLLSEIRKGRGQKARASWWR